MATKASTTPFENLRIKLRAAGCRVECAAELSKKHGVLLWLVYPEQARMPVRVLVMDEGSEGYHLFIENAGISIDGDVQAILRADLCGRLEKA
jgi:hypothetical protein